MIQAAFGWWNCHLHEFDVAGTRYDTPDPDDDWGIPTVEETGVGLDSVAGEDSRVAYTYDFGDNQAVYDVLEYQATGMNHTEMWTTFRSSARRSFGLRSSSPPYGSVGSPPLREAAVRPELAPLLVSDRRRYLESVHTAVPV